MGVRSMPYTEAEGKPQFAGMNEGSSGGGGSSYTLPPATASTLGGVKIGSGIEVTNDGTISANGGCGVPKYFPEETVIGTFNNKPVYARTFTGRTAPSTVSISLPNISYFNVVKESSYSTCDDGNYKLPFGFYNSSNFRYQAFYKGSTGNIEIDTVGSGFVGDYVLTVVYQKTTD